MHRRSCGLSLVSVPGRCYPTAGERPGGHVLDFQIDDVVLGEVVRDPAVGGVMADVVSVLVTDWHGGFPTEAVGELLGEVPSSLPSGRVALYVCPNAAAWAVARSPHGSNASLARWCGAILAGRPATTRRPTIRR